MIVGRRYRLKHAIGRGGYGVVFRALDSQTGQTVAVKVLSPTASRDPQLVERMVREQQAMAALAGTNAVAALDLCRADSGALCLVMEWLEGVDLEQRLAGLQQTGAQMTVEELLQILGPVVDTLEQARQLGIVHRDLKPANIFLVAPPERGVRLLDFGLSRMRSSATITALGTVMGSPSYIAPETWRGNSKLVDHRTDLYSLGVIVFRALAGRLPFETNSLMEMLRLVTSAPRPSLHALRPDLPAAVDQWVRRALAISPDERFQSAREWHQGLVAVLQGLPLPMARRESRRDALAKSAEASMIAAAWGRAASVFKRFAVQLGLPVPSSAEAAGHLSAPAAPPASSGAERPGPIRADVPLAPWPRVAEARDAGAPSSAAATDDGDRPSLISEMLPATDLRRVPTAAATDEELADWLGSSEATDSVAARTASPTLIGFRDRLASTLSEAEPEEEAALADALPEPLEDAGEPAAGQKKPAKKKPAKKKPAKKKPAKKKPAKKKPAKRAAASKSRKRAKKKTRESS